MLIDSDPETAYQHTLAARARAPRLAVVREATGEAAYAAGHYAEALAELRAAKRMNGATDYLPIMADCHRALGQPDQALKLAKSPAVANFASAAKAEMTIVEAGARRDIGPARRRAAHAGAGALSPRAASRGWSACATPTPTPSRRRPRHRRPGLVPPHARGRLPAAHRCRRACRGAGEAPRLTGAAACWCFAAPSATMSP